MNTVLIETLALDLPGCIIALALHEYVRAVVATKLGDPLPRMRGRLSLNPLKHLEPIGFFCMVFSGFGWGNPVPTSTAYYKDYKKSVLLTNVIPILSNFVLGITIAFLFNFFYTPYYEGLYAGMAKWVQRIMSYFIPTIVARIAFSNIQIALFNLIPIHPLSGARILSLYVSPNTAVKLSNFEKPLQMFLIIMLYLGVVKAIITPIALALINIMSI